MKRVLIIALVFVMLLAAFPCAAAANEKTTGNITITGTRLYDAAHEICRLVNIEREKEGLLPLSLGSKLTELAMFRAAECQFYYSHTRPNGLGCFSINDNKYYDVGFVFAENIAMGQLNAAAVVKAWMESPGHRANILNAGATTIGIGAYVSKGTISWCQLFATGVEVATAPAERVRTTETIEVSLSECESKFLGKTYYKTVDVGKSLDIGKMFSFENGSVSSSRFYIQLLITPDKPACVSINSEGIVTGVLPSIVVISVKAFAEQEKYNTIILTVLGESMRGDFYTDNKITAADAEYLLHHFDNHELYPVNQGVDINGDGLSDLEDANYLLYRCIFGEQDYPLR